MSKKFSNQPIRGFTDLYPTDVREEQWILDKCRDIAKKYVYEEFEAPLLEPVEIYAAKSSEELVDEQSFICEKKKGERLILRPELTPSLARMLSAKGQEMKKPVRWFSIPICYRYERPQRGRAREFKQVNFDILGENDLLAEVEIFNITTDILTAFGATNKQFQIYYNNRRLIDAICTYILKIPNNLFEKVYKALDKSDKLEEKEYREYLFDNFKDEKLVDNLTQLNEIYDIENLPYDNVPKEFFKSQGYLEIKKLQELLNQTNLDDFCTFSAGVVRGLDYYTGTVFEVFDTGEKNRRALFGGGRYDDLLSLFSSEQISGIGFGMGLLPLKLFLKSYDLIPKGIKELDASNVIYITTFSKELAPLSVEMAQGLRESGFNCYVDYSCGKIGAQLKKANSLKCKVVLILGPDEQKDKTITIKNLDDNSQESLPFTDLIKKLNEMFNK